MIRSRRNARSSAAAALLVLVATVAAACAGPGSPPLPVAPSGATSPPGAATTSAGTGSLSSAPTATSATSGPAATTSSPAPTRQTSEGCARTIVADLTPAQLAGQLIMVGLAADARQDSLDALIRDRHLGGVILLGGWYNGVERTRAATRHLNAASDRSGGAPGLLLAADQEGGNVQQLRGDGFARMPSALEQGTLSAVALRQRASTWGEQLRAAGINVNLAPVADTVPDSLGRDNDPIGRWDRQFSSDPDVVARMVAAFVTGMHEGKVATATKHFPGIGRITGNTDLTTDGIVDRTTTATDPFLKPFASGISAGTDLVMVGSAVYSRIDPGVQALFSPRIVTDLLRGRLGFRGVVITDDVGAAKAVADTPVGQRATRFVEAGGDIVLTARPSTVPTMHRALTGRMKADRGFRATVTAAATRVLTLKADLGLIGCD
ncbi:glycoside hydrolase family 3 protein [Intrasporangium calvum]|nr:glycoside hydrolase family 3 protein [Intrasporangium calvum]